MKVKLTCFDDLSEKLEIIVQKFVVLKQEKEKMEALLMKKNKENNDLRKNAEKWVKERKLVLQRIDNLINKIKIIE